MAWHKEKKQQTKERILKAAVKLFLNHGFDEVSIIDVMNEANLTHGGFYNHFSSKLTLYEAALHFSLFQYNDFFKQESNKHDLIKFLKKYISIGHCLGETLQCPLVYLSTTILRSSTDTDKYRTIYTQVFDVVTNKITTITQSNSLSVKITSMMVGSVTLARVINAPKKAEMILNECLQDILQSLENIPTNYV